MEHRARRQLRPRAGLQQAPHRVRRSTFGRLALLVCRASDRDLAPAPARSSGAPHQGVTAALGAGKVRVSAIAAGSVQVWLMDEHEKLRSPERVKARLALDIPGYPEIPLAPDGDHLKGKGPPILAPHPNATVFVEASGTTDQARLTLHLEIGPVGHHHEHEPDAAP